MQMEALIDCAILTQAKLMSPGAVASFLALATKIKMIPRALMNKEATMNAR